MMFLNILFTSHLLIFFIYEASVIKTFLYARFITIPKKEKNWQNKEKKLLAYYLIISLKKQKNRPPWPIFHHFYRYYLFSLRILSKTAFRSASVLLWNGIASISSCLIVFLSDGILPKMI